MWTVNVGPFGDTVYYEPKAEPRRPEKNSRLRPRTMHEAKAKHVRKTYCLLTINIKTICLRFLSSNFKVLSVIAV